MILVQYEQQQHKIHDTVTFSAVFLPAFNGGEQKNR
jgi:hypothetical protein